jgi:DNA adenine methylase
MDLDKELKVAFSRVGGKSKLADYIISKIPEHKVYVETCIGGGSIYLKKKLAVHNVINDLDKDIYDLWCDLRCTPPIDYIFDIEDISEDIFKDYLNNHTEDPAERLKRNLFITKHSYSGDRIKYGYKDPATRRVSKLAYLRRHLPDYQYKLNRTTIRNTDWKEIVKQYDSPETFFYIDPPYSLKRKSWKYKNHISREELLGVLESIKGKFIMSYDYSPDNLKYFMRFFIKEVETKYEMSKSYQPKKEILISNFPIA